MPAFALILGLAFALFPRTMLVLTVALMLWLVHYGREEEARLQAIAITAAHDPGRCGQRAPVRIVLTNGSDRTITGITVDVRAREPGTSRDIAGMSVTTTRILPPGASWTLCEKLPALWHDATLRWPTLEWRVEKDSRKIVFARAGEP
ncbi:hypothetical protein LAZ40_00515 [Cereibacter sphaeroides]|uniref:hypothetical protein n=1 Tax=Cereibacter sphaeroides TaxID=1063 RepID=UPI001F3AB9EF|nr:hypothetical protein [Cereibacter sphaeroides]MCE6957566.1 hypothetical protein [Cereibacter sphaeroides]MCE6969873.1 hypothetical protein [Cereibacter sphaeroides]MCE6971303.1 hypothetical protein [Cereibacter sphaeroides]